MLEPALTRIEPIFSPRPWGARSLEPLFPEKKDLTEPIGEAWLSAWESPITTGPFAGKTLGESWRAMPVEWRGSRLSSCAEFPLLTKFIFPRDKLSIQVHPDDEYASRFEQSAGGRGKTEMWHIVAAEPGAELLLGLKAGATREKFREALSAGTVEQLLVRQPVRAGDTWFVAAGTQHAILPGVIVCEVQEYSDLTYRVYDYGRVDNSGKPRALHVDKALAVTNFGATRSGKIAPLALHSPDANKHLLAACSFFATERWDCDRTTPLEGDSTEFQLLIFLHGSGNIYEGESGFPYRPGEAWFLPAALPLVLLQPAKPTSFLRVTVPDTGRLAAQLEHQGFEKDAISRVVIR